MEAAGGYDGGGNQHSLSDGQQLVGGWHTSADAHHEEDRGQGRRSATQGAGPHAQPRQAGDGDCVVDPVAGPTRRRAEEAAVSGTAQLDAEGSEPGTKSIAGSESGTTPPARSPAKSGGIAGDHGGASAASHETDQVADLLRGEPIPEQDRERVRAAHGNHSQGQGEQAH